MDWFEQVSKELNRLAAACPIPVSWGLEMDYKVTKLTVHERGPNRRAEPLVILEASTYPPEEICQSFQRWTLLQLAARPDEVTGGL
ncbi:MAG: hypothetical protein ACREFM_00005 [Hypericibacter sp.]